MKQNLKLMTNINKTSKSKENYKNFRSVSKTTKPIISNFNKKHKNGIRNNQAHTNPLEGLIINSPRP